MRATTTAQTQVQFPALLDSGAFDPARPLQTGQEDGLNYRLYRINGDFKARYELHNYPFDRSSCSCIFATHSSARNSSPM